MTQDGAERVTLGSVVTPSRSAKEGVVGGRRSEELGGGVADSMAKDPV